MYFESYLDSSTEINFIFILCTDFDSASAFDSAAAGDAAIVVVVVVVFGVVVRQNCEMRKPKHSTMYILLTFYNTQIRLKVLIFQHVLIPFHSILLFFSVHFCILLSTTSFSRSPILVWLLQFSRREKNFSHSEYYIASLNCSFYLAIILSNFHLNFIPAIFTSELWL